MVLAIIVYSYANSADVKKLIIIFKCQKVLNGIYIYTFLCLSLYVKYRSYPKSILKTQKYGKYIKLQKRSKSYQ